MTNPQVAIDITANDKSAKGVGSADKRLKGLGRDATKIGDRGLGKFARTFAEIEEAASGAFGNKSVLGGLGRRASALGKIGSTLSTSLGRTSTSLGRVASVGEGATAELGAAAVAGEAAAGGLGEAAAAAGGLAVAMGPVAVIGAAVVATLGAAAVAGYKFASGWAASTAQMGRLAETIGIATKNLQELQGAGERYGIGKDATNSAVGGFAQTVHDARYGRNNTALAMLTRLGVRFKTGADGNLDYNAMLADTSDALKRQKDPQTALMVANQLGVGGILPLLRKGSGNLRAETADIDKHGVVNSDADVATAQKFTRDATMMSQMADRAKQRSQAWTASKYAPALDEGVDLAREATDGTLGARAAKAIGDGAMRLDRAVTDVFAPAATKIGQAADKMLRASGPSSGAPRDVKEMAGLIENRGERSKQWQVSPVGARGVMQLMPATARAVAKRNGIAWDERRFRTDQVYNRRLGELEVGRLWEKYGHDPALVAAAYNAGDAVLDPGGYRDRRGRHQESWLKRYGDPRRGEISDADFAAHIPFGETKAYVTRILEASKAQPAVVHHHHHFEGLPSGAKVKTRTQGSPVISQSFGQD